ncbi:MAG: oligoendopeptidase F [Spirochaetaceae bacterium]|jgi:oligoendopeptidase F|nr:oligoendopeptidase F [Spirochaetaceae bacterium]
MRGIFIPSRRECAEGDCWDLSALFVSDEAWECSFREYEGCIERIPSFKGTLGLGAAALARWLDFRRDVLVLEERLSQYAQLRGCEDEGNDAAREREARMLIASSRAETLCAWVTPEILAIDEGVMQTALSDAALSDYRVYLAKLLRYKPYVLSEKEERLIALYGEGAGALGDVFSVLTNVDIDFGAVETPSGVLPLSQSTWAVFMEKPDRALRETAWLQFYHAFSAHKTTLAALYAGQVKQDVVHARARGFAGARDAALFADDVKSDVYDSLIAAVSDNLAPLHRYYRLRRRVLGLDALRHWDVYVPITGGGGKVTRWNDAVALVCEALRPLGSEYTETMRAGLLGRWADRYENKGKRSGAFSSGGYTGDPYILMNYKEDSARDIFTLAHEAGHSMHSWYSARSNPFMQYSYTIFEAEVASTFNEELLFRHLLKTADTPEFRLYILNKRVDDILATLYRQTMFAEFEKRTHAIEEAGGALSADVLRHEYRLLLEKYFGGEVALDELSDLEALRIPHFYRAFYVYKYATGISAALALANRVLSGGEAETAAYFGFLKSGGSRFPVDSLKAAGVDMTSAAPVAEACALFGTLVDELEHTLAER